MQSLKDYYTALSPAQKRELAEKCGTSLAYLSQIVNGHRRASTKLAKTIYQASGELVTLHSIRSDVWAPGQVA